MFLTELNPAGLCTEVTLHFQKFLVRICAIIFLCIAVRISLSPRIEVK